MLSKMLLCVCVHKCVWADCKQSDSKIHINNQSAKNSQDASKAAGCKINIQKFVAFLYTNNKLSEREIKNTIPCTIEPKRKKYLEINLTNKVKDLYTENNNSLMKTKLKKTTNKWKDSPCSRVGKNNIIKIPIPKAIYRFNAIPIFLKIQWSFSQKQNKQS